MKRFADRAVASVFEAYPAVLRRKLMALRELIFRVAAETDGVGKLVKSFNVLSWEDACALNPRLSQNVPAEAAE